MIIIANFCLTILTASSSVTRIAHTCAGDAITSIPTRTAIALL